MTLPLPSSRWFALFGATGLLFIAGFLTPSASWAGLLLDLLLLALLVVDSVLAARTRVIPDRKLPRVLHQGEEADIELSLESGSRRAVSVVAREVLAPALLVEPETRRAVVEPGTRIRWVLGLTPRLRGDADLAPPTLRVLGPLGLAWHTRASGPEQSVRIYPRAHLEGDAGLFLQQAMERRLGANPLTSRGISTELYALREYLPGDEYRSIHWKESARLNRPVTRENTWEQHQQLLILVDCGRPMASLAGVYTKLDHTLAAVIALMRVVVAQQDSATLVLFSKELRQIMLVDRRTRSFGPVFERIYGEQADLDEPDYAGVAAWCARKVPRRSLALLCTSVLDLYGADSLARALTSLSLRHRPLLVNLEDSGLVDLADGIPETVIGAYAKASAMSIVDSNRQLSARLRGRGIDLLTMPASRLAIGMIQSYLDQKSRRRF